MLRNWFKKNTAEPPPALGMDFHSHLLPGIDDGAQTLEESLSLIRQLQAFGYTHIVTTPHIHSSLYPNTHDTIRQKCAEVRSALREHHIQISFDAAAEYYLDEHFAALLAEQESLLCVFERCVLIEFSFLAFPPQWIEYLFKLRLQGYTPILAHPERYPYLHRSFDEYDRLKDMGCRFQINLLSLAGYYGKRVREVAEALLEDQMVEHICTDLHHAQHAEHIQSALQNKRILHAVQSLQHP